MKYYLIVGYCLLEKNKEFPSIRISLNDRLIEEFTCDNEQITTIESCFEGQYICRDNLHPLQSKLKRIWKNTYDVPAKVKVLELESFDWTDESNLCIEISKNHSNFTNGFVNKRSLVVLRPIYLIPASLHDNKEKLTKFLKKIFKHGNSLLGHSKWPWPGAQDDRWVNPLGGNQKLNLRIKKKLNFYYLTQSADENQIGFPKIETYFFHAWSNHYFKNQRDLFFQAFNATSDDIPLFDINVKDLLDKDKKNK